MRLAYFGPEDLATLAQFLDLEFFCHFTRRPSLSASSRPVLLGADHECGLPNNTANIDIVIRYLRVARYSLGLPCIYSQLSPCGHPAITDSPLLRTGAKSPAETAKKCMEITPAITELRTLQVVRNKHFNCSTLVTTDTLDVFCTRHMKVNDFLIYRVTYIHLAICQRKYFVFEDSVRHHFCRQKWQTEKYKMFIGDPAIADSRHYGHQVTVPRVSAITIVDCIWQPEWISGLPRL